MTAQPFARDCIGAVRHAGHYAHPDRPAARIRAALAVQRAGVLGPRRGESRGSTGFELRRRADRGCRDRGQPRPDGPAPGAGRGEQGCGLLRPVPRRLPSRRPGRPPRDHVRHRRRDHLERQGPRDHLQERGRHPARPAEEDTSPDLRRPGAAQVAARRRAGVTAGPDREPGARRRARHPVPGDPVVRRERVALRREAHRDWADRARTHGRRTRARGRVPLRRHCALPSCATRRSGAARGRDRLRVPWRPEPLGRGVGFRGAGVDRRIGLAAGASSSRGWAGSTRGWLFGSPAVHEAPAGCGIAGPGGERRDPGLAVGLARPRLLDRRAGGGVRGVARVVRGRAPHAAAPGTRGRKVARSRNAPPPGAPPALWPRSPQCSSRLRHGWCFVRPPRRPGPTGSSPATAPWRSATGGSTR